jgi:DNA polymerase delta subunit 1
MVYFNLFPFQWSSEDERNHLGFEQSVIRIYGWNEKNESVYVRVTDFTIPMWIELPSDIEWTEDRCKRVLDKLTTINKNKGMSPSSLNIVYKHKLYFADVKTTAKEGEQKYEKKKFPFIQALFFSTHALSFFKYNIHDKETKVNGIGSVKLKCHCYEQGITPVIKLLAAGKLPSSNWIKGFGKKVSPEEKESTKTHEYIASWKTLSKHPNSDNLPIVHPKVLSFDLEVYSSDLAGGMPVATKPDDVIIQIGCVLSQKGQPTQKTLLHIGNISTVEGADSVAYDTECKMLTGFAQFIRDHDPDVIMGYNIFGFDIPYIENRAKMHNNIHINKLYGCIRGKDAKFINIKWESSA